MVVFSDSGNQQMTYFLYTQKNETRNPQISTNQSDTGHMTNRRPIDPNCIVNGVSQWDLAGPFCTLFS